MDTKYISPDIKVYDSIESLLDKEKRSEFFWGHYNVENTIEDIENFELVFIVGEPGYGKSRLLKELSNKQDEKTHWVDCKSINEDSIRKNVNQEGKTIEYLFIDGLDEIAHNEIIKVLKLIKSLRELYQSIKIIVSCRTHYLNDFKNHLADFLSIRFVELIKFDNDKIIEYLTDRGVENQLVDRLLERSTVERHNSVLGIPRYLEALLNGILEKGFLPDNIRRSEIFEKIIYNKLETELSKEADNKPTLIKEFGDSDKFTLSIPKYRNQNELQLSKRILEKLALILEIYQRNQLTRDELITFFDETQSNICQIFLNAGNLDDFISRTLKRTEEILEFDNTEFQEYLAAKELLRLGNVSQILYDLIIHKELNTIYHNWHNVLLFAIELSPDEVLKSISKYLINTQVTNIDENFIQILLRVDVQESALSNLGLFPAVFEYYQNSGRFIFGNYLQLAKLYTNENSALLQINEVERYSTDEARTLINKALIIRGLCEAKKIDSNNRKRWRKFLAACVSKEDFSNHTQTLLWVLEPLDAKTELRGLAKDISKLGPEPLKHYLESLGRVDADGFVDIYLKIIELHPFVKGKEDYFSQLKQPKSIKKIVKYLLDDPHNIENFFGRDFHLVEFHKLFEAINRSNSRPLINQIEKLFIQIIDGHEYLFLDGTKKGFMKEALRFLVLHEGRFLNKLLKQNNFESVVLRELSDGLSTVLTKNQFITIANQIGGKFNYYFDQLVHSIRMNNELLATDLKDDYPQLFMRQTDDFDGSGNDEKNRNDLYKKFKFYKTAINSKSDFELLSFYNGHKEKLIGKLTGKDLKYLKEKVAEALNSYAPETFFIKASLSDRVTTYSVEDDSWFRYGFFIRLAFEFELEDTLRSNKIKILKYLPLLNANMQEEGELLEKIMNFLDDVNEDELHEFYDFCFNRTDDYNIISATTFANLIARKKWKVFKPILKTMIESDQISNYEKKDVFTTFCEISDATDVNYLQQFEKDIESGLQVSKALGRVANEYLIKVFRNGKSIELRFDKLKEIVDDIGEKEPGNKPHQYWFENQPYMICTHSIKDRVIQQRMLSLLNYALEIRSSVKNVDASNILLNEVFQYFRANPSVESVNMIEKQISNPKFESVRFSFDEYLRQIKIYITNSLPICGNINDAVRIYNDIKKRRYEPVYDIHDLNGLVQSSLDDFKSFFFNEGYLTFVQKLLRGEESIQKTVFVEDTLQKTIKVALENTFLSKGLRRSDFHVIREAQLFDNKRLDLIIKYGFVGSIVLEIKLLHNDEIQNSGKRGMYKTKLIQYINSFSGEYSYYVVLKVKEDKSGKEAKAFEKLVNEYKDIPNLHFFLIDCIR